MKDIKDLFSKRVIDECLILVESDNERKKYVFKGVAKLDDYCIVDEYKFTTQEVAEKIYMSALDIYDYNEASEYQNSAMLYYLIPCEHLLERTAISLINKHELTPTEEDIDNMVTILTETYLLLFVMLYKFDKNID